MDEVLDYAWVRFSINGASKTYASTHKVKPEVLGHVVKNLEELAKRKSDTNMLGVSNIVYPKNWEDIYEVAKIAKESGADNYRISLSHTDEGDKPFLPIWGKILDQIDLAKGLQDENFRVFAFSNRIADIGRKAEGGFCFYHHLTTALGADGELYPCCYFKYLPEFGLGNINTKSFADIWFGEQRKSFIDSTAKDCKGACWMQDKNKLAGYITETKGDVPHINFP
jgi:radical SAM protein with 4Fe4S-binding SPASM domain